MGHSLSKVIWFDPDVFSPENRIFFEDYKDGVERFDDL